MTPFRNIKQLNLCGTPYHRGKQLGARLGQTFQLPTVSWDEDFVEACQESACNVFPPIENEFEGLLAGGNFEREKFRPYYFARVENLIGGTAPGCTMFAITPEQRQRPERGSLVGRNYDWATKDLQWCELHRVTPAGQPRYLAYTHHWAGHTDVLAESGLYVAIASLPPEEIHRPGIQWHIIVEMLVAECTTVDEAVEACASVHHLRPMSYLLADAYGNVGIVEGRPSCVRFRRPERGIITAANTRQGGNVLRRPPIQNNIQLNASIHPRPSNYDSGAEVRAQQRIDRVESLLRERAPDLTQTDVANVLEDHEAPICTGDHTRPDGAPWATIWSGICEPQSGLFSIAPGLPCQHAYHPFTIE